MGAGDGAAEQSRLAAERVARLKRQLDQAERATKARNVDAEGEKAVAESLGGLLSSGWHLLHDVQWPGRPEAILDHVLVGPGGVVVVDTKNWTGEVRMSSGVLWQGRYARTQSVEGALAQCAAVASVMVPQHRRYVRPLICMSRQPDFFGITSSDVAVAGTDRVVEAIQALPAVLDQQAIVALYAKLGDLLARQQPPGVALVMRTGEPAAAAPSGVRSGAEADPLRRGRPGGRRGPRHAVRGVAPGAAPGVASGVAPNKSPDGGAGIGRKSKSNAHHHGSGGMAGLLILAAFVTFAVYVLPYWGR
jgi:hypothetical protein